MGTKGNRNAAHDKPWTSALQRAIQQYEDGDIKAGQVLRKIADRLVKDALNGDRAAREEIANRLDGRPSEHVHQYRHDVARDLGDEELARVVAEGGSSGTAVPKSGEEVTPSVH